ncbi:type I secretion system permease/ATPase [Neptuniibacter sp. PT34_22]|uniref:type I secretion system permease/ATPase n=1 Tax=Neptuniibacter sp. PT34_22 TaxID=3398205 RepID=UPI0039F5C6D7
MTSSPPKTESSFIKSTLSKIKGGLKAVLLFSFFINLLMLAAPLYMLQVFDRVLGSGSTDTLIFLSIATILAIATLAGLELTRGRIMLKLGIWLEQNLTPNVFTQSIMEASRNSKSQTAQGLRDVAILRNFLTGSAIFPIMDIPWLPIFLGFIYLLHPLLGIIATAGALLLFSLAVLNDLLCRKQLQSSSNASITGLQQAESALRNANVATAMGFTDNLVNRWQKQNTETLYHLAEASKISGLLTSASKFIRLAVQIAIMGVGAWLVLASEMTAGAMVAGSILLGRALAPVDQAMGSWKNAIAAKSAMTRLETLCEITKPAETGIQLPDPQGSVKIENMVFAYSRESEPTFRGLNLKLQAGESLGVIGPTASGKSTLAELLTGNLIPESGHIRFDSADIHRLNSADRRQLIGYLPQTIKLFPGTVSENIACMGEIDADAVVKAAQLANLHDTILSLPEGYETEIGESGTVLAGGQRQRLALARALYANPKLLVLDEPNASLDFSGDAALINSLKSLKQQGTTSIIITHRPSILKHADKILVLYPGGKYEIGSREQMFKKVTASDNTQQQTTAQEKTHANIRPV